MQKIKHHGPDIFKWAISTIFAAGVAYATVRDVPEMKKDIQALQINAAVANQRMSAIESNTEATLQILRGRGK